MGEQNPLDLRREDGQPAALDPIAGAPLQEQITALVEEAVVPGIVPAVAKRPVEGSIGAPLADRQARTAIPELADLARRQGPPELVDDVEHDARSRAPHRLRLAILIFGPLYRREAAAGCRVVFDEAGRDPGTDGGALGRQETGAGRQQQAQGVQERPSAASKAPAVRDCSASVQRQSIGRLTAPRRASASRISRCATVSLRQIPTISPGPTPSARRWLAQRRTASVSSR